MVDLKPNLASYARVSYFRELHGDLRGAIEAMRLAASAGGDARENVAYVQTLLGNLELERGRRRRGRARLQPGAVALPRIRPGAGRARARRRRARRPGRRDPPLRARGRASAAARVRDRARRGGAGGRPARAARASDLALVRGRSSACCARSGVNIDAELAVFEADHGSPERAVRLARRAWAAAPSVRAADALGWALTRAGEPGAGPRCTRSARCGSARVTGCSSTTPGSRRATPGAPALAAPLPGAGARGATRASRPLHAPARRARAGGAAMRIARALAITCVLLVGSVRRGRGGRAPARELLRQPPDRGEGVARPRGRAATSSTRPRSRRSRSAASRRPRCWRASAPRWQRGPAAGGRRARRCRCARPARRASTSPPGRAA